jgi:CRP-like cAMP-binding protein
MLEQRLAAGTVVVRQGEPGDRFFLVLEGELEVTQDGRGRRRLLGPGETFGEVALAMGVARTATVSALTEAVVASCDRATFDEIVRPIFSEPAPPEPRPRDAATPRSPSRRTRRR